MFSRQPLLKSHFITTCEKKMKWDSSGYSNPINELQPLLQVPISSLAGELFQPSKEEIAEGHKMFQHTGGHNALVYTKADPELLPDLNLPEVP